MAVPHLDEGGRRSRIQPVSHGSRSGGLKMDASSFVVRDSAHTTGSRADVRIKVEVEGKSRVKLSRSKSLGVEAGGRGGDQSKSKYLVWVSHILGATQLEE